MQTFMNIGQAAEAAGVSAKMIRHYEEIGLMPEATRTESGYRQYTERDLSVLRFIRQSRRLGFSMKQIGDLISLWGNSQRSSREVKMLASQHLAELEQKMQELAEMQQGLQRLLASCEGSDTPHCAIIEGLSSGSEADPGLPQRPKAPAKRSPRAAHAAGAAQASPASSHVDLMAWTHRLARA